MSKYNDFLNEKPSTSGFSKKPSRDMTWNILTGVMLLGTLCACAFFFSLIRNPRSGFNPFAQFTLVPPPATATWTPLGLAATWTPTVTLEPTETSTPRPTYTLLPSSTAFRVPSATPNYTPTKFRTPTRTPRPTGAPYSITVTYSESTTFRADTSCTSMYVAGQALDSRKQPVTGMVVKLGGSIPGKTFLPEQNTTLTGISASYGQSGFEFDLKVAPTASSRTLWIQLYDLSGAPFSEQFRLTTYADCKRNLVFVRFQQK
jgi:hypothetical protein